MAILAFIFIANQTVLYGQGKLLSKKELEEAEEFLSLEDALANPEKVYILDLLDMGLSELPTDIAKLKNLQILYLYENQLTTLPREIGQLKNLQILFLDENQLSSLPPEIGQLTNLEILGLHHNNLKMSTAASLAAVMNCLLDCKSLLHYKATIRLKNDSHKEL